jgi:hypothetical protein
LRSFGAGKAEDVACRVVEDAEALAAWLMFGKRGAKGEDLFGSLLKVLDAEIEVDAARCGGIRPWERLIVGDALKVEADATCTTQNGEIVVEGTHLSAQEGLVELS